MVDAILSSALGMVPVSAAFQEPGEMVDGELRLAVEHLYPGDPSVGWAPAYRFAMTVQGHKVGDIELRLGTSDFIQQFAGHVGYDVEPPYRGNRFAARALRLLLPLAGRHGFTCVWATVVALRLALARETSFLAEELAEVQTDLDEEAAFLSRKLSSAVDLYILAEVEGRVVGIASLDGSTLSRFGHGVRLVLGVRRDCWRQGLGRALMQTLLAWADSRRVVRVALEVVDTNLGAIRLYESLGFEHEGRLRCRTRLGSTYVDNCLMARVRPPTAA